MKYKITDTAVKRLFDLFGDDADRFVDPLPIISQWVINERLSGSFLSNLRDLVAKIREDHPHLVFQITYHLAWELEDAENKLKAIKRGFDAINEID
tara:strand:+ start:949 stop:1236 length:288 start_codon:yes stop_codon:yes gene_type:complete